MRQFWHSLPTRTELNQTQPCALPLGSRRKDISRVENDPLNSQVGGSHYKKYKIQPIEYAMANDLNYCQANSIKYITRYRDKNGKEDLLKAIHNIEILIKLEYGDDKKAPPNGQERTAQSELHREILAKPNLSESVVN